MTWLYREMSAEEVNRMMAMILNAPPADYTHDLEAMEQLLIERRFGWEYREDATYRGDMLIRTKYVVVKKAMWDDQSDSIDVTETGKADALARALLSLLVYVKTEKSVNEYQWTRFSGTDTNDE